MQVVLFVTFGYAQNLPKIQEGSFKAPDNAKIDGIIDEWGIKLQAYNPSTRVFYTIANDQKNIYLILKIDDPETIDKAFMGGISFSTQLNSDAKEGKPISITFPASDDRNDIILDHTFHALGYKQKKTASNYKALDSISKVGNKVLQRLYKQFDLSDMGIEEIETLSLYNTEGIKIAPKFTSKMEYILEIAIPLSFLHINEKFRYNLKVIGTTERRKKNGPQLTYKNPSKLPPQMLYQAYSTDFWSEYTLIK